MGILDQTKANATSKRSASQKNCSNNGSGPAKQEGKPAHDPKGRHTILECINFRKSLQERQLEEDKKKKDKQDDEDGDKDGTMGF